MDKERVNNALNNLLERKLIEVYNAHYDFTILGNEFTWKKSFNRWCSITTDNNYHLWIRRYPSNNSSWDFISFDEITEEQFEDFCNYYEIKNKEIFEIYDGPDCLEI